MGMTEKQKSESLKRWVIIASILSGIIWLFGIVYGFRTYLNCNPSIKGGGGWGSCIAVNFILSLVLINLSWNKLGEMRKGKLGFPALLLLLSLLSLLCFSFYDWYCM